LLLRVLSIRRLPHLAFVCLLIASGMRLIAVWLHVPQPCIWCNTLARLDPIAMGALFAVFNHRRKYVISPATRVLALVSGLLLPAGLLFWFGESCFAGPPSLFFYPIAAVCCVFILIAFFRSNDNTAFSAAEKGGVGHWCSRQFVYLGRISYGLYVFHLFSLRLTDAVAVHGPVPFSYKLLCFVLRFCLSFGLTVGLASASYFLLEKRFLRLKGRFTYVQSTPVNDQVVVEQT
jgi:peptidoglycan/LPS O-acetylase OafA/YrhL